MKAMLILLLALATNIQGKANITGDETKRHPWLHRLVLEGTYRGKNLVLENPVDDNKEYCITSISVNGEELTGLGHVPEIEIDLTAFGFKPGDKIDLVIEHDASCTPLVMNPGVLR